MLLFTVRLLVDPSNQGCGSGCNDLCGSGYMGKKNEEKNALFLNLIKIFIAKR
jgi:hypothetical protein